MLKVVAGQNIADYPELMEAVWRFRHTQFVGRLGWKELGSEDGREIDWFDTDDAIHLIAQQKGRVVGYTRLLRTSSPHLLSEVYPHIMQGRQWPREASIYEWTRCISDESAEHFGSVQASHLLITGVLEFCIVAGIKGMLVETHPSLVGRMLEVGYQVETLNMPQFINNVPVVPAYIGATMSALEQHHRIFGIRASVLDIDADLMNPVNGLGELRHLPGIGIGNDHAMTPARDIDFGAMRESAGGEGTCVRVC